MKRGKTAVKIVLFCAVAAVLFGAVSYLVRPVWMEDNDYDSTYGFYREPRNTIETIFLGTSVVERGITPMVLYEEDGISAYNLASQNQPMMASYYWLEEAYRLHEETLDTVVLDMSILKDDFREGSSRYVKAYAGMRFSGVKLRFMREYSNGIGDLVSNLSSVLSFHDRWKELERGDIAKFVTRPEAYMRGYEPKQHIALKLVDSYEEIPVPLYEVESDDYLVDMYEENVTYFDRIVSFCETNDIRLVLIKTPQRGEHTWSDEAHNTCQALADANGLDFIDFNYEPYFDEIDFSFATDAYDGYHLNLYGATKVTSWLGRYLAEECGNRDVRGDETYAFMREEWTEYQAVEQHFQSRMTDYDVALEEALAEDGSETLTGRLWELYQYDCLCEETKSALASSRP